MVRSTYVIPHMTYHKGHIMSNDTGYMANHIYVPFHSQLSGTNNQLTKSHRSLLPPWFHKKASLSLELDVLKKRLQKNIIQVENWVVKKEKTQQDHFVTREIFCKKMLIWEIFCKKIFICAGSAVSVSSACSLAAELFSFLVFFSNLLTHAWLFLMSTCFPRVGCLFGNKQTNRLSLRGKEGEGGCMIPILFSHKNPPGSTDWLWQLSRSDIVSSLPNLKNKFTMTWSYHMAMF